MKMSSVSKFYRTEVRYESKRASQLSRLRIGYEKIQKLSLRTIFSPEKVLKSSTLESDTAVYWSYVVSEMLTKNVINFSERVIIR
jgi:hypothetical protein